MTNVYNILITSIGYLLTFCLYLMILLPIKKIIKKEYIYSKFTFFPIQFCFLYSVSWVVYSVQILFNEETSLIHDEFWIIIVLVTNIMGCWSSLIISSFFFISFSQKRLMYGLIYLLGYLLVIVGYIIAVICFITNYLLPIIIGWNILLLIAIGVDDVHFLISKKNKKVDSIKEKKIYQIIPGLVNTILYILFSISLDNFEFLHLSDLLSLTFLIPNGLGCLLFIVEIILLIKQKRVKRINQSINCTGIVTINIDEPYLQKTLNRSDSGIDDSMCTSNNS